MLHNDTEYGNEICEWSVAVIVDNIMRFNRRGCIGHYYSGMLDITQTLSNGTAALACTLIYW